MKRKPQGFTLVEAAITLAVLGIVVTTAAPSLNRLIETRRVDAVATQAAADLQFARSEAVLRNQTVSLSFKADDGGNACYVVHTGRANLCKCQPVGPAVCEDGAQQIKTTAIDAAQRIALKANVSSVTFDPAFGTATPATTLRFTGPDGRAIHQVVNVMGRVRSCSPQAAVSGYNAC